MAKVRECVGAEQGELAAVGWKEKKEAVAERQQDGQSTCSSKLGC